ncbi:MAG TPA: sulfotransferase [Acidimicrobiales bacterium]|nr:sulfotransferase [Acidimicrobiales bacterium]
MIGTRHLGARRREASGTAPVFLIGAPRSGTSLLYKCLALHGSSSYISNYNERLPRWEVAAYLNRLPARVPVARRAVWFGGDGGNAYVYNGRRPLLHKLLPMPTEGETLFARCGVPEAPPPDDLPTGVAVDALRRSFARLRDYGGGQRLVCKRIANNLRLPLLVEAFPGATFVLLTRDGRAVASSLRQVNWWPGFWVFWYGSTTDQWEAAGGDPWELAARHWVEEVSAIECGATAIPPDQLVSLRYEDFVADPVGRLAELVERISLPASADWLRELRRLSYPDQNESWRVQLDAAALATIEHVQRDTLRRYGYA